VNHQQDNGVMHMPIERMHWLALRAGMIRGQLSGIDFL